MESSQTVPGFTWPASSATIQSKITFTWYDYALFSSMLVFSVLIGIWFGFIRKQNTASDYLLGGRAMKPFPIAMSLVASKISGVALLAIPADVYNFGINYSISCISVFLTAVINAYVYLPVFHKLQMTSTYEYLKMRFNAQIRMLASFLFTLYVLLHLPVVIYVPALALEQVTNINIHMITPIICSVCIFYTTIGGLKAVVWTDMLQFCVSIGAIIAVLYMGLISAGGIGNVFNKAAEGERFHIDFNPDPTLRDSFWVIVLGWSFNSLSMLGVSQSCVQKFLALPTLSDAKKALAWYVVGAVTVKITCILTGLIMYVKYFGCDPLLSGQITKADKILPHYVMDVSGSVPGLPGLFIAGIFCASLSTLSASLNCLAGTIYEDFLSQYMSKDITEQRVGYILKGLVIGIGVISVLLVRVVEHLGNLLPIMISFTGVASGPLLGIFTLGILFPKANAKGAMVGALTALGMISTLFVTVQYYKAHKLITYTSKPVSTETCDFEFTPANSTNIDPRAQDDVLWLFRISFYYYTLIGASITLLVGNIVSAFTQDDSPPVHPDLLSPIIRRYLPDKKQYYTVDRALTMVTYDSNKQKATS